ncbi:MAG: capsule assembly Wzi family protein [Flavobacteriaceae bacterium]|nr:capsule assembly Wzi family protein [Flavobacteriaceae bacterium]
MKRFASFLILLISVASFSQTPKVSFEKYPVFKECANVSIDSLENCFNFTLKQFFYDNFKTPSIVSEENYKGQAEIFLEITKEGKFKVLYVDAIYTEIKDEVKRMFATLPKITPATYNGEPSYMQFKLPFKIPLEAPLLESESEEVKTLNNLSNEYDDIKKYPYANEEYQSTLNIPLSTQNYSRFDAALNKVGTNTHTSQKPFLYKEVNKYYNFEDVNQKILKPKTSWLGRKWWNEHMFAYKGEDFWFTIDPGVDLQIGKDIDADIDTYNNTRLLYVQGGIGKKISFFTVFYESQGRFADYFNRYAESIKPDGGNPAIIPGRGIAKEFNSDAYDYPVATGYVSYSPSKTFNFQLGQGKNFIGEGYRSLFLSDNASPHPYFKINTTIWKIKYTNIWMSLKDVRSEVVNDNRSYRNKYIASHYLSYNVSKRLNIGLFESVIWENAGDGVNFSYLNPIIFYQAVQFAVGSRAGNALIGFSAKYKFSDRINAYGQFIIDEFSSGDVFGGDGSWKNKTGYQIGVKYYDAFGLKNLYLQTEYNRVRPYTYSHNTVVLNYGQNNQPLAHPYGASFSEFLVIGHYNINRIFGDVKFIVAKRGFDFNTEEDNSFYGADIYRDEEDRPYENGNEVAQGNTTNFFFAELQAGYLINPATSLKIYGSVIFRSFKPLVNTETVFENTTTWVNLGIRTDLFNWQNDF